MSLNFATFLNEKIAHGDVPGVSNFLLTGYNGAITTTKETVWDDSTVYTFRSTAVSTMKVSSSDANDTSAGTGARTVTVTGVDGSYVTVSEVVTLNGQTGVATTNTYLSINSLSVTTAGSGGVNAGVIYVGTGTITAGVPAVPDATIAIGRNVSTHGFYTVPSGKTLILKRLHCASRNVTAGGHELSLETIVNGGLLNIPHLWAFQNLDGLNLSFEQGYLVAEKTQLQFKLLASAGTGPATLFAQGFLITNANKEIFG
jgi:hypothetical protein